MATTIANQLYTLTVALGDDLNAVEQPGLVTIELLVDGATAALASITGAALPNGTFIDLSTSFVSLVGGQALSIRLSQETFGFNAFAWFDNVRLEQTPVVAIPEPGVVALGVAMLLGWLMATRRFQPPSLRSAHRPPPRHPRRADDPS